MKKSVLFLWFAAVFLTIFSAKLWLIDLYGSALPWWDQWAAEGWFLYIPFLNKTLALKDLFTAHCEHRIFVNRVAGLLCLMLNGQWDARLGMVLNAAVTAGTGAAFSALGWTLLGRKHLAMLCLFNTLVFALPFSWECTLLGFVGNYWLIFFALAAIWLLLRNAPFRGRWLLGFFLAALSLVTMGSGFFAAAAALAIIFLRLILRKDRTLPGLISLLFLLAIITAGYYLRVSVPGHAAFQPANWRDWLVSFGRNLAWPNYYLPWTAFIIWLPALILSAVYIRRRASACPAAEFVLAFGLWVALQAAALAFARCGVVTSRHTVFLALALPVNFLAILLLYQSDLPKLARHSLAIVLLIWAGDVGYQLWKISGKANLAEAAKYKTHLVQSEKNVRAFIQTDDIANLENKALYDIPFPDPQALAMVLRQPQMRAILPAGISDNQPGPLSRLAAKLIPKGDKLVLAGIAGLIILAGIRFYQSLGRLEKRLTSLRWTDFKQLLIPLGLALAAAAGLIGLQAGYARLSPAGLTVTYFRGRNFEEKVCRRTEKAAARDYEESAPAWGVPSKNFSALWQGILRAPATADYDFFSQSDDGLRLIIAGQKIIDNWRDQSWGASATGARAHLAAGDHPIAIEYYNGEGEAALRIKWSGGPIPPNTVLAAPYLRKRK